MTEIQKKKKIKDLKLAQIFGHKKREIHISKCGIQSTFIIHSLITRIPYSHHFIPILSLRFYKKNYFTA